MGHYKANVRDIEFNLFEVLELGALLDTGAYGDLDSATVRTILDEVRRLTEGPVAESFTSGDRDPVTYDPATFSLSVPEPLRAAISAVNDAGWRRLGLPEGMGGTPAPAALVWSINEMLSSANPPAGYFTMGSTMAAVLYNAGTDEQKRWATLAYERDWLGTMVLTEPDAGSDVGAARTKAIRQDDGSWHLEGVKRFISGADAAGVAENVFHLVLARPEGAVPGVKGLSLFYVPQFHFDFDTLELGDRNGVFVTGVEKKMGLKSWPTCELTFGAHGIPAKGWLVGEVHSGIAQMFEVIENARMVVGIKSAGTLSTGYLNALAYARTRVQGADLTRMSDKTAPRVTITHHPDVRRSLAMQKAYAEGLRAVYLYTAVFQNAEVAHLVSGADAKLAHRVDDLLLPIVKGVSSERAYELLTESLQTLGGSGYLQDYPIEQYIRDVKIDSLYEGTTAIQAQDFFFRKIVRDKGVAFAHVIGKIREFLDARTGRFGAERALLAEAVADIEAMAATLTSYLVASRQVPAEVYKIGLGSVRFLLAVGDLLIGWRLLAQAEIAATALAAGPAEKDVPFYTGKVTVASFFAKNVLPGLTATAAVLADLDDDIMTMPEDAF